MEKNGKEWKKMENEDGLKVQNRAKQEKRSK